MVGPARSCQAAARSRSCGATTRIWVLREAKSSAELRIRLGGSLGLVGFFDLGNVTQGGGFGFGEPHPAAGVGLRYLTVIGAIRFDLGFRLKSPDGVDSQLFLLKSPGAMHLTIGEAF